MDGDGCIGVIFAILINKIACNLGHYLANKYWNI